MAVDANLLLVLRSENLGEGEPDLGAKLMSSFLKTLLESGNIPEKIICMNSGVFLTTENSPVTEQLKQFAASGSEILSCSTCLNYFGRTDKLVVGKPTDMKAIVGVMLHYRRILSP